MRWACGTPTCTACPAARAPPAADVREIGGLNCFFLLLDRPEVYNLPVAPQLPPSRTGDGLLRGILTMAGIGLAAAAVYVAGRRE